MVIESKATRDDEEVKVVFMEHGIKTILEPNAKLVVLD